MGIDELSLVGSHCREIYDNLGLVSGCLSQLFDRFVLIVYDVRLTLQRCGHAFDNSCLVIDHDLVLMLLDCHCFDQLVESFQHVLRCGEVCEFRHQVEVEFVRFHLFHYVNSLDVFCELADWQGL